MHDEHERDLLIALSLLPFLTPARTRLLREHFVPLRTVCDADSVMIEALLRLPPGQGWQVRNPLTPAARQRVAAVRRSCVTLADPDYPPLLREIVDPPLLLHFRGDLTSSASPCVAIVGSRRASPYAINAAEHLARDLARAGITIVSGLALGVDAAAHRACLDAGGSTLAVLGTGIDIVYPRSNARLAAEIVRRGALLTELPPATAPLPMNFPVRNRIIAGLCSGVVIVEAGPRSGSLITARMAAEQGREVFAVPGSIFSSGSEGTHRLIQSGAKLVHDAVDVLEELNLGLCSAAGLEPLPPSAEDARRVLSLLSHDEPVQVDDLTIRLQFGPAQMAAVLLDLELAGWIRALPGGRYVRAR